MQSFTFFTLLGLTVFGVSAKSKLESLISLCDSHDPNLNECVKNAANQLIPLLRKGNRALDFPPMDPLNVPEMKIGQEGGAIYLKLDLTNTVHDGLCDLKINRVNMDMDKMIWTFEGVVPQFKLHGDYVGHGKILVLPIGGEGIASFTHSDVHIKIEITGEKKMIKNQEHLDVKDAKVHFTFTPGQNVINMKRTKGDLSTADHMSKFIRENSDEVLKGVQTSFEDVYSDIFTELLRRFFNKTPYQDLFQ